MTVSFFSKINHTIGEGTALLIPMDGVLVEQAQEISSFESFFGSNRRGEIELGNLAKPIKAASNDDKINTIVIDLSKFLGGYPADIFYICEVLNDFK
jgi:protease-4